MDMYIQIYSHVSKGFHIWRNPQLFVLSIQVPNPLGRFLAKAGQHGSMGLGCSEQVPF